jgi:hypothetical protein
MLKLFTLGACLVLASPAYARRDRGRDGANFGAQVRMLSDSNSTETSAQDGTHSTTTAALSPFVGYSFGGILGLGLSFAGESTTVLDKVTPKESNETLEKETRITLSGTSLYTKLLFAYVMYMEAGIGVYKADVSQTSRTITGYDSFSGNSETQAYSGVGYGYHFGGGLEIPMGVGFYFNSALYWRQIKMKDVIDKNNSIDLNSKKTELQFGITHYLQ